MKKILIALIVIIALFFVWKAIQTKPDASVPEAVISDSSDTTETVNTIPNNNQTPAKKIQNDKVAVTFKGFGPGKVHEGELSGAVSDLNMNADGTIAGTVSVNLNNMKTDNEMVTKDLKSARFFDVAKYPTATFKVKEDLSLSTCSGDNVRCKAPNLYGTFTIHGVTKDVSFPIKRGSASIEANFTINMKEFGIDQKFANETVEVKVVAPLQ
jgi:polyisoprenoid-binding protein YceI